MRSWRRQWHAYTTNEVYYILLYLNSFVVFVDPSTAWLLTDDFYGKLSATVFQRISAGSHIEGEGKGKGKTLHATGIHIDRARRYGNLPEALRAEDVVAFRDIHYRRPGGPGGHVGELRLLLDFAHHSRRTTKSNELDLSSSFSSSKDEYLSLANITVECVPAVRALMTDLALDIRLYQSATYREHIVDIVHQECNRIYRLFRARNHEFKGKISLIGHSFGNAILFDILCRQPDRIIPGEGLEFDDENFLCLGFPIGLFEILKGNTISARPPPPISSKLPPSPLPQSVSAPKCAHHFKIFHLRNPISFRLERLVSTAMSELKPQPFLYTKLSLLGATPLVGISGLGKSVTRSISGWWTILSSGVASVIANPSSGFNAGGPPSSAMSSVSSSTEKGTGPPSTVEIYAGFQKRHGEESGEEVEEKAWMSRLEEEKVRELNENGRIDFAI
ncbi:hypothetical protein RUND412_008963 [Rhizina undulata]